MLKNIAFHCCQLKVGLDGIALCLGFGHGGLILWNAAQDTLQILERVQILWMIRVAYIQALAGGSLDVSLTGQ